MQIYKIVGPPGTGKTFRVLQALENAAKRYNPERIGAVSFTNAAINEMKDRIAGSSNISKDILNNVKTIHSQCFRLLGLNRDQTAEKHIDEFNKMFPKLTISTKDFIKEDDSVQTNFNNATFAKMNIYRNMCKTTGWADPEKKMYATWKRWMDEAGYIDYTGMLEQTLLLNRYPNIDILFVDEAQDLTKLQMNLILKWADNVEITTMVGDADQAIFRFTGGDPEVFKNLKYRWFEVLKQSYRVPRKILDFSLRTIRQIKDREDFEYLPKPLEGGGEGTVITQCAEPMLDRPGTHMIITRCGYEIEYYIAMLRRRELLWHNPYRPEDSFYNPMKCGEFRAVKTYMALSSYQEVTEEAARDMVEHIIAKNNIIRGEKTKITEGARTEKMVDFFSLMNWGFTEEFLKFDKKLEDIFSVKTAAGELALKYAKKNKLDQKNPIIVGTIHSVKGGEADNVWVSLTKTKKIIDEMSINPQARDDEIRIAYVAFTRAKNFLGVMR